MKCSILTVNQVFIVNDRYFGYTHWAGANKPIALPLKHSHRIITLLTDRDAVWLFGVHTHLPHSNVAEVAFIVCYYYTSQ